MVKDGTIVGISKAITTTWTTNFTVVTYGGPTDLWGTTWTPADINNANFGAVLAVTRTNNGNNTQDAMVDSMQITVYYVSSAATTAIACGNGTPITYGDNIICLVTVSSSGGSLTPSGTVSFSSNASGNFTPNPCTLSGTNSVSTCTSSYTPTAVGSGEHMLTATYIGDLNFGSSSDSLTITVNPKAASATPDARTKVYGETDPTLTGTLVGFLNGDNVTATYSRTAGETVLGSPYIISASLSPASVLGNYEITYNTANFTITKANAACSVSGFTGTYDAALHGASGSCSGIGGENAGTLDLGASYKNVPGGMAHWVFTGNGNYNNQTGDVSVVIGKAAAVCVVTPYLVVYDGQAHTATGNCTGVLAEVLTGLNLSSTTHTQVGTYPADPWTFTDVTGNYNAANGSISDKISARAITVTADNKTKLIGQPDPALTYHITAGTLLSGDSFSGSLTRIPGEAVGTYSILQGSLALPGYYDMTFVRADLVIARGRIYLPLIRR